jgi:hypothetical protein
MTIQIKLVLTREKYYEKVGFVKLKLTAFCSDKFDMQIHQSIAVFMFYLKSFETNSIRAVVKLEIDSKMRVKVKSANQFLLFCEQTLHPIIPESKTKM